MLNVVCKRLLTDRRDHDTVMTKKGVQDPFIHLSSDTVSPFSPELKPPRGKPLGMFCLTAELRSTVRNTTHFIYAR
jgi:hypothetical protein